MKSTRLQTLVLASARHPWRTIAAWLAAMVVAIVAIVALLGGALSTEGHPTNDPQSQRAKDARDSAFPPSAGAVTDIVVVRSLQYTVDAPPFKRLVEGLTRDVRQAGGVDVVRSYVDTPDPKLVSKD